MYALIVCVWWVLVTMSSVGAVQPVAVTADGWQEPNRPVNSVDGNMATRWSCDLSPCEIVYDFGVPLYMSEFTIYWLKPDRRQSYAIFYGSVDGETWTHIYEGLSEFSANPNHGETHPVDLEIRYFKIHGAGTTKHFWNSVREIVFTHPDEPSELGSVVIDPVEISASHNLGGNVAERAYDGNLNTFWTGGQDDYLELDLGDEYPITRVDIAWMNGHRRVQNYAIDVSTDGRDWDRVVEDQSTGATRDYEPNLFPGPQVARYVRIVNNGGNNSRIESSKVKISVVEVLVWSIDTTGDDR